MGSLPNSCILLQLGDPGIPWRLVEVQRGCSRLYDCRRKISVRRWLFDHNAEHYWNLLRRTGVACGATST